MLIRPLDPKSQGEIELVAKRMRETLIEVLGEEEGSNYYTMDWLIQRVRFHLDGEGCVGGVYLCEDAAGTIIGHTIVRIEPDGSGLISTIFVVPDERKHGVASALIGRAEEWMVEKGLPTITTYTAQDNTKLQRLLFKRGYEIVLKKDDMVALTRSLLTEAPSHST